MKKFKTTDYSFCIQHKCNKKNKCMRYIEHYPEYKDYSLSIIRIENYNDCDIFINNGG